MAGKAKDSGDGALVARQLQLAAAHREAATYGPRVSLAYNPLTIQIADSSGGDVQQLKVHSCKVVKLSFFT